MARNLISPFLFFSARGYNFILTRRKGEKILRAILRKSKKIRRTEKDLACHFAKMEKDPALGKKTALGKKGTEVHPSAELPKHSLSAQLAELSGNFFFFSVRRYFRRFGRFFSSSNLGLRQIEELRSSQMDNAIKMKKMTLVDSEIKRENMMPGINGDIRPRRLVEPFCSNLSP